MNNMHMLARVKLIYSIEELPPSKDTANVLGNDKFKAAKKNSRLINVYKIIYNSNGNKIVGYIAEPKTGKNLPCIIWNRGGNREFGTIKEHYLFTNSIAGLAKAGYIVIASQYSGSVGGEGIDEHGGKDLADVLNLYKILQKYSRADISRIGMLGGSRGGMMVFLALAKVKWIKAAVVRAPLSNLFNQVKNRPVMKKLFRELFGGSKEEYKKRSVIYWVDKLYKKAPILLMHGTSDWRVNVQDTLDLGKRLYQEKVPFRMVIYEGDDHGMTQNNKDAMQNTIAWFDKYVKNLEPLPNLKPHGD